MTAILETLIAVPLYWWIALKFGVFWPLAISVAVAPLVLLRSGRSQHLGLYWFAKFEHWHRHLLRHTYNITLNSKNLHYAMLSLGTLPLAMFSVSLTNLPLMPNSSNFFVTSITLILLFVWAVTSLVFIVSVARTILMMSENKKGLYYIDRFAFNSKIRNYIIYRTSVLASFTVMLAIATLVIRTSASVSYFVIGIKSIPQNFRQIVFCTSLVHIPEIVPGLHLTKSNFATTRALVSLFPNKFIKPEGMFDKFILFPASGALAIFILFFPAWLYRLTLKSTAWFWWPLAFLGGDLQRATNPRVFHWQVMGSLWAKASIGVAIGTLLAFAVANFYPTLISDNPLLTPLGYLLLVDWSIRPPSQILALLGALLSLWIVLRVNDANGEYQIAQEQKNSLLLAAAERKFDRTELLSRVRLLVFIAFWLVICAHALLYFNSKQCWSTLSPELHNWAVTVYGDRIPRPRPCQCMVWPFLGLEPLERLNAN